ncbi:MAG: XRE family transcriptional regulator, partial [Solirubrobacteraceae bacterium]
AVAERGRDEGIGDSLAARCRLAASYAQGILDVDAGAVRLSDATLYASIFRFDDELLINPHLWGTAASDSPVLHFRRRTDHGVPARAIESFDRVWRAAQPVSEDR